ncbi:MAG: single-stranded-DNA-specific exonuclease RecJ [Firmicutes bacterium]|nr:single-stranded-DNA-specific exonuclease RecJ [Bacillota bacterium]
MIARNMNINPIIKNLLKNRGIESEEDILEFLSDKPQKTYDPFLLPDMEAGVDLILSEIENKSNIWIYGDYDADGITSTSLMMSVLGHLTDAKHLNYYIPSRFEEGYGLNKEAIEYIASQGCNLLITVDCGSVSYDEVEYAKSLGMKVLVTDHHNITDVMADCLLINPKKPGSQYPFKEICGCGVAFKVAQALQQRANLPKQVLTEVLDLVAVGTVGDIMPLVDENRTMVKFGLKVLNLGKRPGLRKLMEGTSLHVGKVSSENLSFVIVPHLNASGRIEDASQAVELLAGNCSEARMDEIVADVIKKNNMRKKLQNELFKECQAEIDRDDLDDIILIHAEDAHEGIAGIVAGKLKETYYRPSIIVTATGSEGDELKGTGRSVEGVNLYELLKTQEDLFLKFGGHAGACGFSLKRENLPALRKGLAEEMSNIYENNPDIFVKKYDIDLELDPADVTYDLVQQLDMLAPFGNKNPKPLVACKDVIISDERYMGNDMQHLRFNATGCTGKKIQCVLFGKAQDYNFSEMEVARGNIIGNLECQIWQGSKRLQFIADEIQFDEKVPG